MKTLKTKSNKTHSLNQNSDIYQQILLIKRWSELTGTLHSAQVIHLMLYWAILTDSVGGKIAVDIPNRILEFRCTFKGKIDPKKVKSFKEGVAFIVGDNWSLRFKKGLQTLVID
jgi:hypothetical protein